MGNVGRWNKQVVCLCCHYHEIDYYFANEYGTVENKQVVVPSACTVVIIISSIATADWARLLSCTILLINSLYLNRKDGYCL